MFLKLPELIILCTFPKLLKLIVLYRFYALRAEAVTRGREWEQLFFSEWKIEIKNAVPSLKQAC